MNEDKIELSRLEELDVYTLDLVGSQFSTPNSTAAVKDYRPLGRLAQTSTTMNALVEGLHAGEKNKETTKLFPSSFKIGTATFGFFATPNSRNEIRKEVKNANINAAEKRKKIHNIFDLSKTKKEANEMEPTNELAEFFMGNKNLAHIQWMNNDGWSIAAYSLARIYARDAFTIPDKLKEKFSDTPIDHELARTYLNNLVKSNPVYAPAAKGLITFLDEYRDYKIQAAIPQFGCG